MVVWIIGTDHRIQWIPQSSGPEWSSKIAEFAQHLKAQCEVHAIQLVAEEFSEYLVRLNNAQDSTASCAVKEIGCNHLFCDPDPDERAALGIQDDSDRENEWLRRLVTSGSQRILFICGEDHADSFTIRLKDAGHTAQVISRDWGQGWEMMA